MKRMSFIGEEERKKKSTTQLIDQQKIELYKEKDDSNNNGNTNGNGNLDFIEDNENIDSLQDFKIEKKIGSGSFGKV